MLDVRWLAPASAVLLFSCLDDRGATSAASPDVGVASQALGACDEMVPANRNIDGVPAYAQCSTSENSAIYSNNGVDTSLTQQGSDWVKTQWSGGYQCTELAHRYLFFKWGVKWIPNGDAGTWCDTQPPANSGVVQTMTPVHGDIMVLAPGSCGAGTPTGHVNLIDTIDASGTKLVAVEQNRAGRSPYMLSCGKCFLHVVANNGTPTPLAGSAGSAAPPLTAGRNATTGMSTAAQAGMSASVRPDMTGRAGSSAPSPVAPISGRAGGAAPQQPVAAAPVATVTMTAAVSTAPVAGGPANTAGAAASDNIVHSTLREPIEKPGCSVAAPGIGRRHTPANSAALGWLALAGLALMSKPRSARRRSRRP
jgi:hypothetical protein